MTMAASSSGAPPPSPAKSWNQFLQSPAISYPAASKPALTSTSVPIQTSSQRSCEFYWHPQLLDRWQAISISINEINVAAVDESHVHRDADSGADGCGKADAEAGTGLSSIKYGSYILMATFLAEKLRQLLSLAQVQSIVIDSHNHLHHRSSNDILLQEGENHEDKNLNSSLRKVGIAIPEGPFLPLYILAVHSLNLAVSEDWLCLIDDGDDDDNLAHNVTPTKIKWCQGVVIIPMETDDAPERLKHMLADAQPDLILVAPGKDWERMHTAVQNAIPTTPTSSCPSMQSCIQLVDFVQLVEDAESSLRMHLERNHHDKVSNIVELLWPPEFRNEALDSLRYLHSIQGCFDVVRLVALGLVRLSSASSSSSSSTTASIPSTLLSTQNYTPRPLISHIVYTSGTTGKPKGCVSSLASLQNYIRAKNLAHSIDSRSRVLLASAITFDPCFSDVLAVCVANATLCVATRGQLYSRDEIEGKDEKENADHRCRNDEQGCYRGLTKLLRLLKISHVLCTPTLWATVEGTPPNNVPTLKIVALGGEPIPTAMIRKWARCHRDELSREYPRLCSTYGVTEACVYQTFGEVVLNDSWKSDASCCNNLAGAKTVPMMSSGQSVGLPLIGTNIHICYPHSEDVCVDQFTNSPVLKHVEPDASSTEPKIGEVVLSGSQVDAKSSYLNLDASARVFIKCHDVGANFGNDTYFYRTGDLGYIDPVSGNLHILGRIQGDNMVKINGVRVELSEIEHAIIDEGLDDDEEGRLVVDCIAALVVCSSTSSEQDEHKQLVAYCLLSTVSILQLGISTEQLKTGIIVPPGPLMTVLRARCERQVRKGCIPSVFILIDRIPLSPTGKRCRSTLPTLDKCSIMNASMNGKENISLWDCGTAGSIVADAICECLNLQRCQRPLVTLDANFFALGGDSLAATRVVRRLYAIHHGILDSRNLGGRTGTLAGNFSPKYLLQSNNLGEFVEHLDSKSIFQSAEVLGIVQNANEAKMNGGSIDYNTESSHNKREIIADPLYACLIEAITLGYTSVASSLLDLGVDPNSQSNQARLGKVTDRKQQRSLFKSNPLHLASLRGNPYLVKKLLQNGCKANTPDASGSFPIHLACSRIEGKFDSDEDDWNRLLCVKHLLDTGKTPLTIKDGNRQTILHSAARSGHCQLLKYLMDQWRETTETAGIHFKPHNNVPGRIFDWQDRWYRTPVHWAVLNQRTAALRILLDGGCSAFPSKPKCSVSSRATTVLIETPLEICLRLYGDSAGVGAEMSSLLCTHSTDRHFHHCLLSSSSLLD